MGHPVFKYNLVPKYVGQTNEIRNNTENMFISTQNVGVADKFPFF